MKKRLIQKSGHQVIIYLMAFIMLFCSLDAREISPKLRLKLKGTTNSFSTADNPVVEYASHSRGNMELAVANNGTFGTFGSEVADPITGELLASCEYPKNSDLVYLWVGALWIGAVVGRDTLVSCATEDWYVSREYWPTELWWSAPQDKYRSGAFEYRTIDESSPFYSEDAYSEEDIYCEYDDTRTDPNLVEPDQFDRLPHKPLNIKVTQRSMAWSYSYADDFILFDYQIENVGIETLNEVYMGIFVDGDVWHTTRNGPEGWNDDIVGFLAEYPSPDCVNMNEKVNIAYTADNDGDPEGGAFDERSVKSVVGARVIRTPSDSLNYSFNWWRIHYSNPALDFGPRRKPTEDDPFRDMNGRLGTPEGDKNKYYVMRHKEFDYDLIETAVDHSDEGWLPPPEEAAEYAMGYDMRYLLSFGPFDIDPGEKLPITFAWVGGENFHQDPTAFESHDPLNPNVFKNKLNFSELATNSRWASWVYDNPGVDTDGDGFFGEYCVNCYDTLETDTGLVLSSCDTIYYEGDGVPDFRGASPPPAPKFWLLPEQNKIKVRFNGFNSETARDQFSGDYDFEGYRVYYARDNRSTSYSLLTSYDKRNYNKYVYNRRRLPDPGFELLETPFTLEELQDLYGESFNPELYTRTAPYQLPGFADSVFYFVANDYNASDFGYTTDIVKIYPDQPFPSVLNADSVSTDELTEDGYLKYFEYEYTIDDLLPSIPYYVNVTAFDFGSPVVGLPSLESSILNGAQLAYPLDTYDETEGLNVSVYPNPYRIDADYPSEGYENRDNSEATDRARRIHFTNLPNVCTIKIFSLDGDLVTQIDHNFPNGSPEAMHEEWNMITRNTQAIVTGIYYFVVESETDTQIGKLVIIK